MRLNKNARVLAVMHRRTLGENVERAKIKVQGSKLTFCTGCTGVPNFFS